LVFGAVGIVNRLLGPGPQTRAFLAHLHHELAVLRVLQDLGIAAAAAGQPHVVHVVDVDAVLLIHPRIVRSGAPMAEQIALLVELEDERRRRAAQLAEGRLHFLTSEGVRVVTPMHHPHVVLRVHPHAHRGAKHPVIR
jgi:hypothetical protein